MNDHTPHTGDATTAEPDDARPVIKTVLTANPNRTKAPHKGVDR